MGLVRGFVLNANRRGLLAVLAIAVSVSYTLLAGAAVSGLREAQEALELGDVAPVLLAVRPDGSAFTAADLDSPPARMLAVHEMDGRTVFAVRGAGQLNATTARAGPSAGLAVGDEVRIAGRPLTIVAVEEVPGALATWIEVSEEMFAEIGGAPAPDAHVAVFVDAGKDEVHALRRAGFVTATAPALSEFYERGAEQVVTAVGTTILASALVVGLLSMSFVGLELRAMRRGFATLQVFAGPRLVRRLVLARGATLLVAGHLVGLAVVLLLVFLLRRAGAANLDLSFGYVAFALSATLVGGFAGLAPPALRAASRLKAMDLEGSSGPPRMPSPLRPLLAAWRSAVPLAVSAMVLAASLGVIYGMLDLPGAIFGTAGTDVIASTSGNPLRGSVSAFLGLHIGALEEFEAASPEIFAPTALGDTPLIVRGVEWELLEELDGLDVVAGRPMRDPGDAVAGARLAARHDLHVGGQIMVPAAYVPGIAAFRIVGIASGPGILEDELLVGLDDARSLTGLSADSVNLVRTRARPDPERADEPFEPPTGVEVTGLRMEPPRPVPFEPAEAIVEVANFAPFAQGRNLTLRVDREPVFEAYVTVEAHHVATVRIPFRAPATDTFTLRVNPTLSADAADAGYTTDAPRVVAVGAPVAVLVADRDGAPAAGVDVALDGAHAVTDERGAAAPVASQAGNRTILVTGDAGRAARPVVVVEPGDLYRPHVLVRSVAGPTDVAPGNWSGYVLIENVGGRVFQGRIPVDVDGVSVNTSEARLLPGQVATAPVVVPLDDGVHHLGPADAQLRVVARTAPAAGPGGEPSVEAPPVTVEELLAARRARARETASEATDPTAAFLGDTFDNLNAALTVVTLATVLHAALVTMVAVQRGIEERARTVGTLAAIGVSAGALRSRALRDHLLVGLPAAVAGTAVGLAAAWGAGALGILTGFGHALLPRATLSFSLRLAAAALLTTLVVAVLAVERVRARAARDLLSEGPTRSARPPLETLLGGST